MDLSFDFMHLHIQEDVVIGQTFLLGDLLFNIDGNELRILQTGCSVVIWAMICNVHLSDLLGSSILVHDKSIHDEHKIRYNP